MSDMRDIVIRRLEDAGRTLQMLPADGMPAGAKAAWPDVLQSFWDIAGKADEGTVEDRLTHLAMVRNATRLGASSAAIGRLDEVLGWLLGVRKLQRIVLFARMLNHPISEKPLQSWAKIAKTLGVSKSSVQRWHAKGVQEILNRLAGG